MLRLRARSPRSAAPPAPRDTAGPAEPPAPPETSADPLLAFSFAVLETGDGNVALRGVVLARSPDEAAAQIARHPSLRGRHAQRSALLQGIHVPDLATRLRRETAGVAAATGPWRVVTLPVQTAWWPD